MSALPVRILVGPLFYESLSGEFTLESNNKTRAHTLGRLAFEAVDRGEQIRCFDNDRFCEFYYRPDWAPKVLAKVTCVEDICQTVSELSELSLITPNRELIFQNTIMQSPDLPGVAMMQGRERKIYNIHFSDGMNLAKSDFALIAQSVIAETTESRSIENI